MAMYQVEVVYGHATKQSLIKLQVAAGSTVLAVIEQSNILTLWPEINLNEMKLGIFGKLVEKEQPVKNGDRIEIYRPLTIDPKQARLLRAAKNKKTKKSLSTREP